MNKILLLLIMSLLPLTADATTADLLFKENNSKIYQIRVINVLSGDKSSIGSGFSINDAGMIATNYHVVSEVVQHPDRYRLEYRDYQGDQGTLSIHAIDVVHDLALVQRREKTAAYFKLSSVEPSQGSRTFSMGNPFDLGMTIIEGNYNGRLEYSMHERVLFSASLNPGMSGGPAFDAAGQVVGINVSTMGGDVSFLVPVKYLQKLQEKIKSQTTGFHLDIKEQLFHNQEKLLSTLLSSDWALVPFGKDIRVPERISNFVKCWGDSPQNPKHRYTQTYRTCSTEDNIYLSSSLRTGTMKYRYNLLQAKDLNRFQFESLYQQMYGNNFPNLSAANEQELTPYQCNSSIITQKSSQWKASFCSRKYKKYSGLHDMMLIMAQLGQTDHGVLFSMGISGVEQNAGMQLLKKFSESFQWQN